MVSLAAKSHLQTYVHKQKPVWNAIAISYTLVGYLVSLFLLVVDNVGLNSLGVIWLTHSLTFSAYLSHELMHGNICKTRSWNEAWGSILLWLNGGCYFGFKALTRQHIDHHVDRVDVFTFDPIAALKQQPVFIQKIILTLEWLYFPIMGFWSRWQAILAPFWNSDRPTSRRQVVLILVIRCTLLTGLFLISSRAVALYCVSYIGMIHLLRWAEAFQHTYEAFPPGTTLPKRNVEHEQANTFSTLLSRRYPQFNLLLLNFGYHNAHHALMTCPWHSLHQLDEEIAQTTPVQYVPLMQQLINYHKFRTTRFSEGLGKVSQTEGQSTFQEFYGAHDVSFLMLY